MLDAHVEARRGQLALAVALDAGGGETLVLVGESGAGKTSVLRMLAGLDPLLAGHVRVGGSTWEDARAGIRLSPADRSVGWVPQDAALFPHLTVAENVAFGLRNRRDARSRAMELLERVGAGALAARAITALSGGERQRVALARALAMEPQLLLLDEPLSALDGETRAALRATLRSVLPTQRGATILVTHSPTEALALGGRIAVLEGGRVVQVGAADDLLAHPRSRSVAAFFGANFFRGAIVARPEPGLAEVVVDGGRLVVVDPGGEGEVLSVVPPAAIVLSRQAPEGSARNVFRGPIRELVPEPPHGERLRVVLDTSPRLVAEVTAAGARALALAPGAVVHASFKATAIRAYR